MARGLSTTSSYWGFAGAMCMSAWLVYPEYTVPASMVAYSLFSMDKHEYIPFNALLSVLSMIPPVSYGTVIIALVKLTMKNRTVYTLFTMISWFIYITTRAIPALAATQVGIVHISAMIDREEVIPSWTTHHEP